MATLVSVKKAEESPGVPVEIEVPASTAWPLVLAFGFTLMFAGLLTSASVSVLGVVLAVAGCVGWFREVFPHEHEEAVPIVFEDHRITTERRVVERVPVAPDLVRAWLPLETYPISAGLKGGLAGGVAMAVLACTYGLLKAGSIWYPINLLAATVYAEFISCGQLRDCPGPAWHRIHIRGIALWCNASHVRAATDRTWGADYSGAVVRAAVLDYAASQSSTCKPH